MSLISWLDIYRQRFIKLCIHLSLGYQRSAYPRRSPGFTTTEIERVESSRQGAIQTLVNLHEHQMFIRLLLLNVLQSSPVWRLYNVVCVGRISNELRSNLSINETNGVSYVSTTFYDYLGLEIVQSNIKSYCTNIWYSRASSGIVSRNAIFRILQ